MLKTLGLIIILAICVPICIYYIVSANSQVSNECKYESYNDFQGLESFKEIVIHAHSQNCSYFQYKGMKIKGSTPSSTPTPEPTVTLRPEMCVYSGGVSLYDAISDSIEKDACEYIWWNDYKMKGPLYKEPTPIPYISINIEQILDVEGNEIDGWTCTQEENNLTICQYTEPTSIPIVENKNNNEPICSGGVTHSHYGYVKHIHSLYWDGNECLHSLQNIDDDIEEYDDASYSRSTSTPIPIPILTPVPTLPTSIPTNQH